MNLGEGDRLFFQQIVAKATNDEQFRILATANEYDKFELAVHNMIDNIMVQMLNANGALVNKYHDRQGSKEQCVPDHSKVDLRQDNRIAATRPHLNS